MAASQATTVAEYLAELPDDRREALSAVREVILANLPAGFEETMNWGMISYELPLSTYPDTYNGKPLSLVALASQKRHMAVYLTAVYGDEGLRAEFEEAYRESGKRMDMGKSCVRFTSLADLPLDLIGRTVAAIDQDALIASHESRGKS